MKALLITFFGLIGLALSLATIYVAYNHFPSAGSMTAAIISVVVYFIWYPVSALLRYNYNELSIWKSAMGAYVASMITMLIASSATKVFM